MSQHAATAGARQVRLDGWVRGSLLIGVVALGLPWGQAAAPGYTTDVRVPVIAGGLAILLGWRAGSAFLVRVGMAGWVVAILLASLVGGGAIAMAIGLVVLEMGLRRTTWAGA